jgi:hypothetical protein
MQSLQTTAASFSIRPTKAAAHGDCKGIQTQKPESEHLGLSLDPGQFRFGFEWTQEKRFAMRKHSEQGFAMTKNYD